MQGAATLLSTNLSTILPFAGREQVADPPERHLPDSRYLPASMGAPMKTSTDRILTTHVGSLARPTELLDTMKEKEHGRPYDAELFDRQVRDAVADRVRQQVENGIDVVTDGEMSKVSFLGYVKDRLGGFEAEEGSGGQIGRAHV